MDLSLSLLLSVSPPIQVPSKSLLELVSGFLEAPGTPLRSAGIKYQVSDFLGVLGALGGF